MPAATILLIGADKPAASMVRQAIYSTGQYCLQSVANVDSALARLKRNDVDLILAWMVDPAEEKEVTRLLEEVAQTAMPVPTIVLCQQGGAQLSRRLLLAGAVDCLSPVDTSRLALLVDVFSIRARRQQESRTADSNPDRPVSTDFALGTSVMDEFMDRLHLAAPLDTTILITGETGTGKTRLARVIHEASQRKDKPFVVIPCGALSTALIESEMFGHVRGAFTHAESDRIGKFAQVEDGTLLLDEIDCVPLEAQVKLLRAFEERVFEPVGSNQSQQFRGRVIAASNRPLAEEVKQGRFRSDLYYRINVIDFTVPPLRKRPEMVRPLTGKFAAQFAPSRYRPYHAFSSAALTAMEAYQWPGNVRELRNVVERVVVLCPHRTIDVKDLPERIRRTVPIPHDDPDRRTPQPKNDNSLAEARRSAERGRLIQALRHNENNRSQAALELGVSRVTLYKKLRKYGLA